MTKTSSARLCLVCLLAFFLATIPTASALVSVTDSFTDSTKIASTTQIDISGGQAQLDTYLSAPEGWWNSSWGSCRNILIDSGDIDADLTDFPILVYLNSSNIEWSKVQDDLDDLRFTVDNSTLLMAEVDKSVVNTEAWIWVKIPSVNNATDTELFYYYNNPSASSYWNPESVWDSNFVMVQHMKDDTTSTILDSTSNNRDGTKVAANQPLETISGQIDSAQTFDGDDYITLSTVPSDLLGNSDFSISFWVEPVASGGGKWVCSFGNAATNLAFSISVSTTHFVYGFYGHDITHAGDYSGSHHYTIVKSGLYLILYLDGVEIFNELHGSSPNVGSNSFYLGKVVLWDEYHIGVVDEFRVYNIVLGASWVFTNYETQRLHLLSYGAEQNAGTLYYDDGVFQSINLLLAINVTEITSFSYNSSITGTETISFQFSQNLEQWYSDVEIGQWVNAVNGSHTLPLSILNWRGGFFYYRCNMTSGTTPLLYDITVNYSSSPLATMSYTSFVFIIAICALTLVIVVFVGKR